MREAVIVSGTRTPIGRAFKGSLIGMRPDDLVAHVVKAALEKAPGLAIEDLILGCAQPAGESGYNMARVAGLLAGLQDVPGTTVNRYCASSMQALRTAVHAIRADEGDAFVVAGVETVSRFAQGKSDGLPDTKNPIFDPAQARNAVRTEGGADPWQPAAGLPDIYLAMGQTAENVAEHTSTSRAQQDAFAARSQNRAGAAWARGFFDGEVTPVTTSDGTVVSRDDCPRPGTTVEKLATLRTVFRPDGTVTAGNCCPLNDGACALVVTSRTQAESAGLTPRARILSTGLSALNPEIMGLGPVAASQQALGRAGLDIGDIDLVEINEAFAAQVLPSAKQLGIPMDKLNVNGGAIALGHPFGMTGARLVLTVLRGLEETGGRYGLATLCVGGGQGMAVVIERL